MMICLPYKWSYLVSGGFLLPFWHSDCVVILTCRILLIIINVCVAIYYIIINFILIIIPIQWDWIFFLSLKKCSTSGCSLFINYLFAQYVHVQQQSICPKVFSIRICSHSCYSFYNLSKFSIKALNFSIDTWPTIQEGHTYEKCTSQHCLYHYFPVRILVCVSALP